MAAERYHVRVVERSRASGRTLRVITEDRNAWSPDAALSYRAGVLLALPEKRPCVVPKAIDAEVKINGKWCRVTSRRGF